MCEAHFSSYVACGNECGLDGCEACRGDLYVIRCGECDERLNETEANENEGRCIHCGAHLLFATVEKHDTVPAPAPMTADGCGHCGYGTWIEPHMTAHTAGCPNAPTMSAAAE